MKNQLVIAGLLSLGLLGACHHDEEHPNTEEKHWSYEGETGPEFWKSLEDNDCGGDFQSPVNIINAKLDASLSPLDIHYSEETTIHDVVNNGHSIQFNFDEGDYIVLQNKKYLLKQFHFHEGAEHTINGVRYPIVIHLVHVSEDGQYAVIAVLGEESTENSDPFEFLDKFMPIEMNETKTVGEKFDMTDILPDSPGYYHYVGSLTTPPCTENVQWYIYKQPIEITQKLIDDLKELMPIDNYRGVQPLNGRVILESN